METGRTEEEKVGDERNRQAPKEPLPGENGKKGKERAEGRVVRSGLKGTKETGKQAESPEEKRKRKRRETPVERLWERNREG